ncbi:MAG: protein kinase [Proteobacteria bacterium]|jgi:serine/threonine-protein kinase|nr:protein kinase [Pseudomonadota bacterium]
MGAAMDRILTGKTIAGKFRLGERLSEDLAGSIYAAVDVATNQNVIVLALAEGVRLEGEKDAAALKHPNVLAHRQSYFPNASQRFVTSDAPTGKSLARIVASRGKMHPGPAAGTALQILSALDAIHGLGTFHGNLNPYNVFVDKTEKGELEVRLLYPGGARADSLPENVRYLAPEQILGEGGVDRRADLWAVGALLYLCLFGRPPFDGNDQETISGKILLKDPIFPPEAAKMPPELVGAIRAALSKEPEKRPQSASAVIGDLLATAEKHDEQTSALVAAAPKPAKPPAPPPVPTPAVAIAAEGPTAEEIRAAQARAITAELESALEIELLKSVPPEPVPIGRRAAALSPRDKRKVAIAALCLAAVAAIVLVIALLAGGEDAPSTATTSPREAPLRAAAREPAAAVAREPVPQEPPAPVREEADEPAASSARPVPSVDSKSPPPAAKPPVKKKPKPGPQKEPASPKDAAGLASNPFGG